MPTVPTPTFDAYALVIGIGQYERLPRLTETVNDAQAMHNLLVNPPTAATAT